MNPIPPDELAYINPLVRGDGLGVRRMLELGNKKNANGTYKRYFESLGIEHTSIDWNGQDGALPMDLRKPIMLPVFDMVTNIGTTEHVSNQAGVWRNIHELCAVNGIVVSITPYHDGRSWWWHGEHYPTEQFFEALQGFQILKMGKGRQIPNENLCVRLLKTKHCEFVMPPDETIKRNTPRSR